MGTLFSEHTDAFWLIDLIDFNKNSKTLQVKVLDYFPENNLPFDEQTATKVIKKIEFKALDFSILRFFLSAYSPIELQPIIELGSDAPDYESPFKKVKKEETFIFTRPTTEVLIEEKIAEPFVHFQKFKYFFKDTVFKLGFVEIQKQFPYLTEPLTLKIYNSDILPEYDYIKNFFPKAFHGRKQFSVKVELEILGDEVVHYKARSPEISAICDKLIDSIKQLRTLQIPKIFAPSQIDKSLFTADEIFENTKDEGLDNNIFQQTETDIFNILLESKDIRNKKQLQYLAGLKQSTNQKLRFTLSPIFGFLFFIEGEKMYHFCWELLNSNATYLWSFDKLDNIETSLQRVQESVNIIRDLGRKKYKKSYRQNTLDVDLIFTVINHKHANSTFKDGFVYWKHRFKECMV